MRNILNKKCLPVNPDDVELGIVDEIDASDLGIRVHIDEAQVYVIDEDDDGTCTMTVAVNTDVTKVEYGFNVSK